MSPEALKEIWKNESNNPKIDVTMQPLVQSFKIELRTAQNRVRSRDRREIVVALSMTVVFIVFAFVIPIVAAKMASVVCALSMLFVVGMLRQNREAVVVPKLTANYKEQLLGQHSFITKQMRLLNTVLYWYVLPIVGSQLLFIWSLGNPVDYNWTGFLAEYLPVHLHTKIFMTVFFLGMGYYLVWLNKKAVRVNWEPLLTKIEKLRSEVLTKDELE